MERNDFYKILKNYPKFVLKKDLNYKQIEHALKYVMPGVKEDDFIAFYDTGVFKNGKKGMAITKHGIYDSESSAKILYLGLDTVRHRQKDASTSEFMFIYADGRTEQYAFHYPNASELADLILEIASAILTEQQIMARLNQLAQETVKEKKEEKPSVPATVETPVKSEADLAKESEALTEKGMEYYDAKEDEKAYPLFVKAADMGDGKAMYMLGVFYQYGLVVEKNVETAMTWYEKAASKDYAWAFFHLANHQRLEKKDYEKACAYYEKGARLGSSGCQAKLGLAYERGIGVAQNFEKAFYWYNEAAKQNHSQSLYFMGFLYLNGEGVKKDEVEAYECFEKAARLGNAASMYMLGNAYKYGTHRPQNYEQALYWYEQAAQKDDATSLYEAGLCYKDGIGCVKDSKKALDYLLRAVDKNAKYAAVEVAICYMDAVGTSVDREKTEHYYKIAVEEAKTYASYQMALVDSKLKRVKHWLYPEAKVELAKDAPAKAVEKEHDSVGYKKMDFAWDLYRIRSNASKDERNASTINEISSLIEWGKALQDKDGWEEEELYEDDLLEYVARNYYFTGMLKQALHAYRVYLDRHDDLAYNLPKEVRDYLDSPDIDFIKDDQYLIHLKALYEMVRDYSFKKRHPELEKELKEKKEEPKQTTTYKSVFRDYMVIDADKCIACGECYNVCDAIKEDQTTKVPYIEPALCDQCSECLGVCLLEAIS